MTHWIAEAIVAGLEQLDVDQVLAETAKHVTTAGEWERGVISPSLVAKECRLQRLKTFLGHAPRPGQPRIMAVRQGKADAVSVINMTRGFLAEGMMVAALKHVLGSRVLAHAPTFNPRYVSDTGLVYAGHPDMLLVGDFDDTELIQFKSPSVFKLDRVELYGEQDALRNYLPQIATELYIARNSPAVKQWGRVPIRNNLVLFSWEGTPKNSKPRIIVIPVPWTEELDSIPIAIGDELEQDVINAREFGIWPDAMPEHEWDIWPCSYCPFSRLGDYLTDPVLPRCDDHAAWEKN